MRHLLTLSWMLIAMVTLGYGMVYGYDALTVALGGDSPKKMTLAEVEQNGIGKARYVELSGFAVYPRLVYEYPKGQKKENVVAVYYPLVSQATLNEMLRTEKPKRGVAVIVRRDDLDADVVKAIIRAGRRPTLAANWLKKETIKGVVQRRMSGLPTRVRALLNQIKLGTPIGNDVIYLRADQRPMKLWIPIAILLGSLIGVAVVALLGVRQFRRKPADVSLAGLPRAQPGHLR
ncbi:MAG: hypothetical protein KC609_08100 [Myxococcales bacterium]|nr:hypothetical protein [Myxococcales bacterium]